jgi:hypothetical protein
MGQWKKWGMSKMAMMILEVLDMLDRDIEEVCNISTKSSRGFTKKTGVTASYSEPKFVDHFEGENPGILQKPRISPLTKISMFTSNPGSSVLFMWGSGGHRHFTL